jgi:hypothetical protein
MQQAPKLIQLIQLTEIEVPRQSLVPYVERVERKGNDVSFRLKLRALDQKL